MDRNGFKNRIQQYKKAREENPGLKYWEWKSIPKYDEGTENVNLWEPRITAEGYDDKGYYAQAMNFLPEVTVVGSKTRTRSERPIQFTYVNGYPEATTITTDYNVEAGALERVYPEFEILTGAKLLSNSLLSNSLTNELKFNNPPLSGTRKVNRNSVAAKRHLGTYNQSTDEISGNTISTLLTEDGSEQFVFNSFRKNNEVFKMPHAYGRRSIEDLYKKALEYLKFNKVPNYSKVRLEGHVDNGRGVLYPIFSQKRLLTLNNDIYSISGNQRWNNEIMPSLDKAMSKYGYKNIDGKYIKGNKIVGDIHPGNVAYDANGNIKLIDAHIDGFAGGGEVTGPPTYEQWYADMNQYNPTILDDASMYWSIEAAKKALHNEAMKLPGYAERWTEYYRSLPKNVPDINEFVDDLWENENPSNVGYKKGKYYPHKSPEGGAATIGPGFKLGSGSHNISTREANNGVTKTRLNQEARRIGKQHLNAVDQFLNYGQTTNPADTVSSQIKMGLMDLRHQVGPLNEWSKLRNAVLEGDLDRIKKESTVTWEDNGVTKVDKRRKKLRDEKYWHYEEGGEVKPDPMEVLERSRPKVAGIPINDPPIESVFSPWDIALGTSYRLMPFVNKLFPNYGPALGTLVLGDAATSNKLQPLITKKLDPDVSEFYKDIVIPMNPNDEVYKQYFMKQFGNPDIEIHPASNLPDNFAADYNPNTNKIRIIEDYAMSPNYQQIEAHEYGHLLDKYLPYDETTQQQLNNSLKVSKAPISKDSDTYRERQSSKREGELKAFLNLKKAGKMKVKTSRAKTKRYQEYLANASDEEILELLGADTAYKQDYLAGNIDIDTLRLQMIYAPTITAGLVVPEYLLIDDEEEKQWT